MRETEHIGLPQVEPQAGDSEPSEGPFVQFFEAEYSRLVRSMYLVLGDPQEAEDVAQEAMARVFERWDRVRAMEAPDRYVHKVALNLSRRSLRKRLLRRRLPLDAAPMVVEDSAGVVDEASDIRQALLALSSRQREILVLKEWMDLSTEEIAKLMRLSPGAVRVRLHRARARLRVFLEGTHV